MDSGWAVVVGAGVGFVASLLSGVLLPWWREVADRKRRSKEATRAELRRVLLEMETALLAYRLAIHSGNGVIAAQTRYAASQTELALVIPSKDTVLIDIVLAMFGAVQDRVAGDTAIVGETFTVVNAWYRDEISTADLLATVEERAGVKFSDDHRTVQRTR